MVECLPLHLDLSLGSLCLLMMMTIVVETSLPPVLQPHGFCSSGKIIYMNKISKIAKLFGGCNTLNQFLIKRFSLFPLYNQAPPTLCHKRQCVYSGPLGPE